MRISRSLITIAAVGSACVGPDARPLRDVVEKQAMQPAYERATNAASRADDIRLAAMLKQHVRDLTADSMEGNAPGTAGEERTIAYLQAQFKALGLKPGNPDGTYVQQTEMIGYKADAAGSFHAGGKTITLNPPDDFVAMPYYPRVETKVESSGIVFVGHGVVAPEFGVDDYKGIDVRGKTVLMFLSDLERQPSATAHESMILAGRPEPKYWTREYRDEVAAAKGAAAVIFIPHADSVAPFALYNHGWWTIEEFDVRSAAPTQRVSVEGYLNPVQARELVSAAGRNFDSLMTAATQHAFTPVALNATANFDVKIESRRIPTRNVVARVEGTDRKDEYVVATAYWDHLERNSPGEAARNYDGALINERAASVLIEVARKFAQLRVRPRRSILFVDVIAEQVGFVGAMFYATHPLFPPGQVSEGFNFDNFGDLTAIKSPVSVEKVASSLDIVPPNRPVWPPNGAVGATNQLFRAESMLVDAEWLGQMERARKRRAKLDSAKTHTP